MASFKNQEEREVQPNVWLEEQFLVVLVDLDIAFGHMLLYYTLNRIKPEQMIMFNWPYTREVYLGTEQAGSRCCPV